jgi:hypothetical protein
LELHCVAHRAQFDSTPGKPSSTSSPCSGAVSSTFRSSSISGTCINRADGTGSFMITNPSFYTLPALSTSYDTSVLRRIFSHRRFQFMCVCCLQFVLHTHAFRLSLLLCVVMTRLQRARCPTIFVLRMLLHQRHLKGRSKVYMRFSKTHLAWGPRVCFCD